MDKEKFKALRFYHEMTQNEMAAFLNVSQSTIDAIESGARNITPFMRGRIAARFTIDDEFNKYYANYQRASN